MNWPFLLIIFAYYLPAAINLCGYSAQFVFEYKYDKKRLEAGTYHTPNLTIGWVLFRILLIVVPLINVVAAVFDILPTFFGDLPAAIKRVLDTPIVRRKK